MHQSIGRVLDSRGARRADLFNYLEQPLELIPSPKRTLLEQHSTAQHSTAQHSTAQHGTVQTSSFHQLLPYVLQQCRVCTECHHLTALCRNDLQRQPISATPNRPCINLVATPPITVQFYHPPSHFPLACCPPPPLPPVICCIKSHANWSPGPSAVIFLDHGLHEAIDWREETPDELVDYGKIPEFKPVVTYADVPGIPWAFSMRSRERGGINLNAPSPTSTHFVFETPCLQPPTSSSLSLYNPAVPLESYSIARHAMSL